jgi:hypothetical protein
MRFLNRDASMAGKKKKPMVAAAREPICRVVNFQGSEGAS